MSHPLKLSVKAVRVLDESNESSASDEPYVIVFVADVGKKMAGITVPSAKTTHAAWTNADEGEILRTIQPDEIPPGAPSMFFNVSEYCWGPNGKPAPIPDPDNLIILAGIMENDDGSPSATRSAVNSIMAGALGNMSGSNLSRNEMADRLRSDMAGALNAARVTGIPNHDDRVGPVRELRLRQSDLDKAHSAGSVIKRLEFNGGDDEGAYRVAFELQRD